MPRRAAGAGAAGILGLILLLTARLYFGVDIAALCLRDGA